MDLGWIWNIRSGMDLGYIWNIRSGENLRHDVETLSGRTLASKGWEGRGLGTGTNGVGSWGRICGGSGTDLR